MKMSFYLPRQVWFVLIGIALVLAFGWVATKSGPFAAIKVLCHMVPTPLQCMARAERLNPPSANNGMAIFTNYRNSIVEIQ